MIPTGPARSRFALLLGLVVLAALALRITFTVVVDPPGGERPDVLSDARAYHLLGLNLAHGHGYVRPFDLERLGVERPTAEYPPLFPAVLAALTKVGIDTPDGQQLALCFVGAATVALVGLVGRRVGGETVGLVAAAIAAGYPMLFQADAILMTESLFAFLVAASLLLAYRAVDHPTGTRFAALGAVLGLAALTRAEALLLTPLLVVAVVLAAARAGAFARLRLGAIGIGVAVLVVVPWTARNASTFDSFIPVSNNLGTLLDGANCAGTYSGTNIGFWRSTFGTRAAGSDECFEGFRIEDPAFDEADAAATARDAGMRYARDHASRLPVVAFARLGRTFGVFDVHDEVRLESLEGRTVRWETLGTRLYWLLVPLAVYGTVVLWRRRVVVSPLLSTVALVAVTSVVTYGNQRFRIAAEPAIVVLAAAGAVAVIGLLRGRAAPADSGPSLAEPTEPIH